MSWNHLDKAETMEKKKEYQPIESEGFYVIFSGDESAGIFGDEWEIKGYFNFEDQEDFEMFKKKIAEAWEWVAEPVGVESFEERKERIKEENDFYEHIRVSETNRQ